MKNLASNIKEEEAKMISRAGVKGEWFLIYQTARYSVLFLPIIVFMIMKIFSQPINFNLIILGLIVFMITTPRKELLSFKTPFTIVLDYLIKKKKKEMNQELTRAFSMFKNLAVIYEDNPPSGLFFLEKLSGFTETTKPIFLETINFLYENKAEEAAEYFERAIGTDEAREFASVIKKLDDLQPHEFKEQINDFYKGIMETRKTKRLEEHENMSFILYGFFAISSILVVSNFIVIAYIIDGFKNITNLSGF